LRGGGRHVRQTLGRLRRTRVGFGRALCAEASGAGFIRATGSARTGPSGRSRKPSASTSVAGPSIGITSRCGFPMRADVRSGSVPAEIWR
jgi:hypothetical protein